MLWLLLPHRRARWSGAVQRTQIFTHLRRAFPLVGVISKSPLMRPFFEARVIRKNLLRRRHRLVIVSRRLQISRRLAERCVRIPRRLNTRFHLHLEPRCVFFSNLSNISNLSTLLSPQVFSSPLRRRILTIAVTRILSMRGNAQEPKNLTAQRTRTCGSRTQTLVTQVVALNCFSSHPIVPPTARCAVSLPSVAVVHRKERAFSRCMISSKSCGQISLVRFAAKTSLVPQVASLRYCFHQRFPMKRTSKRRACCVHSSGATDFLSVSVDSEILTIANDRSCLNPSRSRSTSRSLHSVMCACIHQIDCRSSMCLRAFEAVSHLSERSGDCNVTLSAC